MTSADMPQIGEGIIFGIDTTQANLPGSSGAGQTWNFSTLSVSSLDTEYMINPANTQYNNYYPGSTVAIVNSTSIIYNLVNSTLFAATGIVDLSSSSPAEIWHYRAPYEAMPLPCTYQTKWNQTSFAWSKYYYSNGMFDSIMKKFTYYVSDTIDSWGSCTTPTGTFNTIRDFNTSVQIDSFFHHNRSANVWSYYFSAVRNSKIYLWYANGIHDNLIEMICNSAGKPLSTYWVKTVMPNGISSIPLETNNPPYPNPARAEVSIKISSPWSKHFRVMDATGREVEMLDIESDMLRVNTAAYRSGLYFYQVLDNTAQVLSTGKFVVEH